MLQVTAARRMVKALRAAGRLEPVDVAQVEAFIGLAQAVDAATDNASLWRQYREAEATLRKVGDGDPDAVQALLDELRGAEVRDSS